MNILKSKIKLMSILWFGLLLILTVFFIFLTFKVFSKSDYPPIEIIIVPGVCLSLCSTMTLITVLLFKRITLTEKELIIQQGFSKAVILPYNEIIGYNDRTNYDKFGEYHSFSFKIRDGKSYLLSSRQFNNYNELTEKIMSKTQRADLGFFGDLKLLFTCLLIMSILTSILSVALYYS